MYSKYQESKLEASVWLLSFCGVMAVGMFLSFVSYVTSSSVQNIEPLLSLVTHILSSLSIALLFSLGLIMMEKKKYLLFPLGFVLLQIVIKMLVFLTEIGVQIFIDVISLDSIVTKLSYVIMVVPIIILFFYLFMKTGSDKSLGFSLGMLLTLIAGFSIIISYDISGLLWTFASVIVLLGIKGYFKPILAKIRS
ncbi:MAG: hypothetical protein ACTSW1_02985, partial [Candidatus Hodarchaeales archaeon]